MQTDPCAFPANPLFAFAFCEMASEACEAVLPACKTALFSGTDILRFTVPVFADLSGHRIKGIHLEQIFNDDLRIRVLPVEQVLRQLAVKTKKLTKFSFMKRRKSEGGLNPSRRPGPCVVL